MAVIVNEDSKNCGLTSTLCIGIFKQSHRTDGSQYRCRGYVSEHRRPMATMDERGSEISPGTPLHSRQPPNTPNVNTGVGKHSSEMKHSL